ncbi:MAG: hypothetical protein U5K38_12245 [Woeseiaceae bacterium]|nr:hypothetical protein [Woeseiaceae bacterium]
MTQLGLLAAAPALISLNIESLAPGMLLLASILVAVRLIEE